MEKWEDERCKKSKHYLEGHMSNKLRVKVWSFCLSDVWSKNEKRLQLINYDFCLEPWRENKIVSVFLYLEILSKINIK